MTLNFNALDSVPRLLIEAKLKPLQGERFQPTGFADLDAAQYTLHDGTPMLLVESAQSVANRMELACWDETQEELIESLQGLPYIKVMQDGDTVLTNSILEAHRINSEYIMKSKGKDSDFKKVFSEEISYAKDLPVNWKIFHAGLLKYDPNCLIHGCFLEKIGGRLRITRSLSGFIEAKNICLAESGGVKNNHVQPDLKEGKGNVPYPRTEFTAKSIKAYFNVDLALIRSYRLGDGATNLLIALALFKIQRFLSTGLRLRTACDLCVEGDLDVKLDGYALPSEEELLEACRVGIAACKAHFADPAITEVKWEKK